MTGGLGVTLSGGALGKAIIFTATSTLTFGGLFVTAIPPWQDGAGNAEIELTVNGASTVPMTVAYIDNLPVAGTALHSVGKITWNSSTGRASLSKLSSNFYMGSGDGVTGTVYALEISSIGDIYMGGNFTY